MKRNDLMALPFTGAQLSQAKQNIENLGFILQQNAANISQNKPLSNEMQNNFDDLLNKVAKTLKLDVQSYIARPDDFSLTGVLLISLFSNNKIKNNELKQAKLNSPVNEAELAHIKESYSALQEEYEKVCKEAKNIAANSPDTQEYALLKQKLVEAEKRIELQSKAYEEEKRKLENKIQQIKASKDELEKEIEDMQTSDLKSKRSAKNDFEKIGKIFGISSCHSSNDVINGVREKFNIPGNETNICEAIKKRADEENNKYSQLLQTFGVKPTTRTPQTDITNSVQKSYIADVMRTLTRTYGSVVQGQNIPKIVDSVVSSFQSTLNGIIVSFNLPPTIDNKDIVEALKQKMRGRQSFGSSCQDLLTREISFDDKQTNQQEREELQKKVNELQQANEELQKENSANEEKLHSLEEENKKLEEQNSEIGKCLIAMKSENRDIKKKSQQKMQIFQKKVDQLSQVVNELISKLSDKKKENLTLKQDNETAMKIVSKLEKSLENEKTAYTELEQQMNTQITQIQEENDQLKQDLEQTQIQKSALSNLTLEPVETETSKKLQAAVNEIIENYQDQCNQLKHDSQIRLKLISIIRKQSDLLIKYDEYTKKQSEENQQTTTTRDIQVHETILAPQKSTNDVDDEALIKLIDELDLEGELSETVNEVKQLAQEEDISTKEKLSNILNLLVDTITKGKKEMNEEQAANNEKLEMKEAAIARMIKILQKQTAFIEQLATSNVDMNADLRDMMLESIAKTQGFLVENGSGLIEDRALYDATNVNSDPLKLLEAVEELFEKYRDINTDEGKELLLILAQSVAVSSVLRRYGSESQTQITRLSNELKKVRAELDSTRGEMERRIKGLEEDEERRIAEINEKARSGSDIIDSVKNILRANITNPELLEPINLALENLRDGCVQYELDPNEYNDALATELQKTKMEFEQATTREINPPQMEESINEEENVNEESAKEEEINNLNKKISEQEEIINNLNEEVNARRSEIEKIAEENGQLQTKNNELLTTLKKSEKRCNQLESSIVDLEKVVKDKYKAKLDKAIAAIVEEQNGRIEQLQRRIKSVQRDNTKAIEQKNQEIEQAHQQYQDLAAQKENVERELKTSEAEAQNIIINLRTQLRDLSNQKISSELETKVLQQRIKSVEERMQREKDDIETQYSLKQLRSEEEIKSRTARIQEELENKKNEFLTKIVSELREFADPSIPVTETNIIELMSDIYTRLKINARDNERIEDLDRQMREIRQIIEAPKGTRTIVVIKNIIDTMKDLKLRINEIEKHKQLQNTETSADEWNSWGKKMVASIFSGKRIESPKEIRQKLEDALYASVKDKTTMNKLELLRRQKKILADSSMPEREDGPHTLCSIICSLMFIRRVQRLSHHIPTDIFVKNATKVGDEKSGKHSNDQEQQDQSDIFILPKEKKTSISDVFARSFSLY